MVECILGCVVVTHMHVSFRSALNTKEISDQLSLNKTLSSSLLLEYTWIKSIKPFFRPQMFYRSCLLFGVRVVLFELKVFGKPITIVRQLLGSLPMPGVY